MDEAKAETKRRFLAIILVLYLIHAFFEVRLSSPRTRLVLATITSRATYTRHVRQGAPYLDVLNSGFLFVGLFGSKRGLGSLLTAWMVRCLLSTAQCSGVFPLLLPSERAPRRSSSWTHSRFPLALT